MVAKTLGRSNAVYWDSYRDISIIKWDGGNMKWNKSHPLIIGTIATSIVVFNNLSQLIEMVIYPEFQTKIVFGFIIILGVVIAYSFLNIKK